MSTRVNDYIRLLRQFMANEIEVADFERTYLQMFKNEEGELPEAVFQVLDTLFSDVDSFCADPELRSDDDLDEEQLRDKCVRALERLMV